MYLKINTDYAIMTEISKVRSPI